VFMRKIEDERLAQSAYLVGCQATGEAIVIDPERDVDRYLDVALANELRIVAVAETHIHADFLSGARELAERVGATVYLSDEGDADWKYQWLDKKLDGGTYDHRLLTDGDTFSIGNVELRAVHTPGHTPEHLAFLVTDHGAGATEPIAMITGDFLFVGDLGRPDLLETAAGQAGAMEPSARRLFETVRKIDHLPEFLQVWPGHGAGSACGKALGAVPTTTVGYERRFNPALRAAADEDGFVGFILSGQPEPPLYFARMKRENKHGPAVLGSLPNPVRIAADRLRAHDPRRVAIVDLRDWERFRGGRLPGSLHLPLNLAFSTDAGSFITEDEPIFLVAEPWQVEDAVRALVRVGLDDIRGWMPASELDAELDLETTDEIGAEAARELAEAPGTAVLDVRRAAEFDEGHVPGATNIAHTRLAASLDRLPDAERLIVHCRTGKRSARACAFLERAGYDVVNVAGGYEAWEKAVAV
jgi:hydroxyacylglutathione hydrolase